MSGEKRIFGTVGAEELYRSVAEVYERVIDDRYDPGVTVEIEEWTVADNRQFLPDADWLIDVVIERLADEAITEGWYLSAENHAGDTEVEEAFTAALNAFADRLTYWMADKHVASHWVVTGDSPTVNGEPLYRRVGDSA